MQRLLRYNEKIACQIEKQDIQHYHQSKYPKEQTKKRVSYIQNTRNTSQKLIGWEGKKGKIPMLLFRYEFILVDSSFFHIQDSQESHSVIIRNST